jgi:hypothetical protein
MALLPKRNERFHAKYLAFLGLCASTRAAALGKFPAIPER